MSSSLWQLSASFRYMQVNLPALFIMHADNCKLSQFASTHCGKYLLTVEYPTSLIMQSMSKKIRKKCLIASI